MEHVGTIFKTCMLVRKPKEAPDAHKKGGYRHTNTRAHTRARARTHRETRTHAHTQAPAAAILDGRHAAPILDGRHAAPLRPARDLGDRRACRR